LHSASGNGAVSDQKISKFFVSQLEKSLAGHVGVNTAYSKLGKGITKWSMVSPGGSSELMFALKTYANLWEKKNLVIPNQESMSRKGREGGLSCPCARVWITYTHICNWKEGSEKERNWAFIFSVFQTFPNSSLPQQYG
jgi:hypothetical protein